MTYLIEIIAVDKRFSLSFFVKNTEEFFFSSYIYLVRNLHLCLVDLIYQIYCEICWMNSILPSFDIKKNYYHFDYGETDDVDISRIIFDAFFSEWKIHHFNGWF